MNKLRTARAAAAVAALAVAGLALVGCSSGTGGGSGGSKTWTLWDPYPQYTESSDWLKLLEACGTSAGVTLKRTAFDTTDLTNKALLAGQQGNAPDLLQVDNPVVSTLADSGMLTTTDTIGIDTSKDEKNQLSAGVLDGKTYGIPIGANTLALFYNKDVLAKAGVDPASITDWTSLNDAIGKVVASGSKGITFSAVGTEEGSFSFLPWFWGAGGDLKKLDSDAGVAALSLLTDWVKKGWAPNSVLQDNQTVAFQNFATGDYGFTENNTSYQNTAVKQGLHFGVISIPAKSGGPAAAPTGGEFITMPIQKDTARYKTTKKILDCITSTKNIVQTDTALSYIAPNKEAQAEQLKLNPDLQAWVTAVNDARTRTGDNLGTDYPKISQPMWEAYQAAVSGSATPADALKAAQQQAEAAVKKK